MSDGTAGPTTCPLCKSELSEGELSSCAGCGTPYHAECLAEFGGCAVLGCSGAARRPGRAPLDDDVDAPASPVAPQPPFTYRPLGLQDQLEDALEAGGCCLSLFIGLGLSVAANLTGQSNDWVWWWWCHAGALVMALALFVNAPEREERLERAFHELVVPLLPLALCLGCDLWLGWRP